MSQQMTEQQAKEYWRRNVSLMVKLLVVWFVVSFGFGIMLVDVLNQIQIGGYKLGFWFAQQGSIYVFVVLIFYYARKMGQLDREFGVEED
jgi:putative solute:sodium symporter small subunit